MRLPAAAPIPANPPASCVRFSHAGGRRQGASLPGVFQTPPMPAPRSFRHLARMRPASHRGKAPPEQLTLFWLLKLARIRTENRGHFS